MKHIRRLVWHHSASRRNTKVSEILAWHTSPPNNFRTTGYNFVIVESGKLYVTRPLPETGAHAKGANFDSIGVCITGDNRKPSQRWNAKQIVRARLIARAVGTLWPSIKSFGHRDVGVTRTLCPGLSRSELLQLLKGD